VVVYDVRNAKLDGALERHGRYEDGGETVEVGLSLEHLFGFAGVAEMIHGFVLLKEIVVEKALLLRLKESAHNFFNVNNGQHDK